jgi:hypothetical protein
MPRLDGRPEACRYLGGSSTVAAGILPAIEGRRPATRKKAVSKYRDLFLGGRLNCGLKALPYAGAVPPGRMLRLYGRPEARRYESRSVIPNLMIGVGTRD